MTFQFNQYKLLRNIVLIILNIILQKNVDITKLSEINVVIKANNGKTYEKWENI